MTLLSLLLKLILLVTNTPYLTKREGIMVFAGWVLLRLLGRCFLLGIFFVGGFEGVVFILLECFCWWWWFGVVLLNSSTTCLFWVYRI